MDKPKFKFIEFQQECDRLSMNEIVTLTREDHRRIMEMLLCERPPFGVPPPPDQEPTAISRLLINRDAI